MQLDASSLLDSPGQQTPDPEPEPSPSPDSSTLERIEAQVEGLRELCLFSGGALIFWLGALFFRSRKG